MHEGLLARAVLPPPMVVLGMLLKPYSLGHELWLIREGNPLAHYSEAGSPNMQDLAAAVLICCQTFEQCRSMQRDWFLGLKLKFWRRRCRKKIFEIELQKFRDYSADGSLEFPLSDVLRPERSTPRSPGAPLLLRLRQFLIMQLGISPAAAWDYPLGLAKMEWEAYWESEQGLEIYNHLDAEHDAAYTEFLREQEKKGAAQWVSAS